jgi:hypothetical protein
MYLHFLAPGGAKEDVVEVLLDANPVAVAQRDGNGKILVEVTKTTKVSDVLIHAFTSASVTTETPDALEA